MGFFDFLKRNKNVSEFPRAVPASASFPSPVSDPVSKLPGIPDLTTAASPSVASDEGPVAPWASETMPESPLVAMARIISGDDPVVVEGLRLLLEDESAFAASYTAWYQRVMDDDMSDSETERQRFLFTQWLIYNHEEGLNYGSYMDHKQQPESMLWDLQYVADRLDYPLRLRELPISENDGRSWEKQLEVVHTYISKHGYELVPLYDQWAGFHLFLTPEGGFSELYELGREVDFDFSYPF